MAREGKPGKFNRRKPHFYVVYSSTSTAEKLKIPKNFVRHMEGEICGSVSLMGPSGNTWHAQLIQLDGDLFIHHGWSAFVRDHLIDCGDLLVFRYKGELHFTVRVFDQSECEKEAAFFSECTEESIFDYGEEYKRRRKEDDTCLKMDVEDMQKKMRVSSSEVICQEELFSGEREQSRCLAISVALPSQMEDGNKDLEAAMENKSAKDGLSLHSGLHLSMLSAHDEKKVAQSFTSRFPYFVRIMKSFNVSGSYTLNIPCQFSTEHLPNCKIKIILHNVKGQRWTVNSVPTTRVHTSHTLCGGWMAFVRDNHIKFGDICFFELVHECELLVHIIGVGKDRLDCHGEKANYNNTSSARSVSSNRNINSKCTRRAEISDKKRAKMYQDGTLSIDRKKHNKVSAYSKKMIFGCQSKAASKKKFAPKRDQIEDELSSRAKAGLRMLFARDEQRVACFFTSSFPSFVKIMKMFNVSGSFTLKIPHQFSAAHLPNCKTLVMLQNSQGKRWAVNSVPDAKGRAVHTFCGGWMAFVRDNNINFGDTCIFELVAKFEMRVHISGVGKQGFDTGREDKFKATAAVPLASIPPYL